MSVTTLQKMIFSVLLAGIEGQQGEHNTSVINERVDSMGLFDNLFSRPQPAQVAPSVMDKPSMTDHRGQVLNANMIIWRVHQYIVDTSISKIIYDKYYQCDSEYQARSLANSLNSQSLAGTCVNRCDFWGEYAGQDFQTALAQIRERIKQDYQSQFDKLASKASNDRTRELDTLYKKYLALKQDYAALRQDYDKREQEHKAEYERLKQGYQRQIDSLREQEQEPPAPQPAPPDLDAIREEIRQEEIYKAILIVRERAKIAIDNVIHVLTQPDKNQYRAQRLAQDSDFVQLKGDTATRLVKYYLYKLIDD